jgi:hypothetical protein
VQRVINAAMGGVCLVTGGNTDSLVIYEADGVNQTGRPISFGRVFAQGEFAQCLQPVVGGTAIANYQVDVKNRWPGDNSVKIAAVTFLAPNITAGGSLLVTFQPAASCNNGGYLTQAQMLTFNSGNWDADIEVTAGGVTRVADAKTMLTGLGFKDCQLNYWQQGPVVTQVIVQDCTSATAYDFGWRWNGSSMTAPVMGNASTASLHPIFILSFYPGTQSVKVDYIFENMWTGRGQDQRYSLVMKAGSPLAQVYSEPLFTHIWRTRSRKTFWSGTSTGHIRIDHNFPYLISTKALPNYDLVGASVDPSSDYSAFATCGDKGDIAGAGWGASCWPEAWNDAQQYSANNEGALLQREDLDYLYNMGTCGTVNGKCAEAWDILTGEVDANSRTTLTGVTTGCTWLSNCWPDAGAWGNIQNVPMHMRESRTDANRYFYCPGFASKDATPSTSCGGATIQTGRGLSRDAYPQTQQSDGIFAVTPVGTWSLAGWSIADCAHWLDYSYVPYLLTGEWFYLDEEQQAANFCLNVFNPDTGKWSSNGFYAYINPSFYTVIRQFAWGMQTVARAAFISPDGSVEQGYYAAKINSNLEVQEGFMQIKGTALTPAATNDTCSSYNPTTANRWDWGRCTVGQNLPNRLYALSGGECSVDPNYVNPANATDFEPPWQYWFASNALAHLNELGYSNVSSVLTATQKRLIEQVLDPTYNPYLVAAYESPLKNGSGTCPSGVDSSANPLLQNWATVKAGFPASMQSVSTFWHSGEGPGNTVSDPPWGNFACADHGYSLVARAVASFATRVTSSDANCAGGVCSGQAAWSWLNSKVPYFNNNGGSICGNQQIKFAIAPR